MIFQHKIFCFTACAAMLFSCKSQESNAPSPSASGGSASGSHAAAPESHKPATPRTSGPIKNVTMALANDGGIEGSLPDQVLSETLMALDEITRKESTNIPLMVTYLGLLRLYAQNPTLSQEVQKRSFALGQKDFWYSIESAYTAISRREFVIAENHLARASAAAKSEPMAKAVLDHANGVRLYYDGKQQLGLLSIKRAAQTNPPFLPALLTIGFMSLKYGDYAGAEQMFERATEVAPYSLNAKMGLGVARRVRGKTEESQAILGQLFRQKSDDRRIAWNYALALSDGDAQSQKKALDVLGKYFQLPGSFPDIDARANALLAKLQSAQPAQAASQGAAATTASPAGK